MGFEDRDAGFEGVLECCVQVRAYQLLQGIQTGGLGFVELFGESLIVGVDGCGTVERDGFRSRVLFEHGRRYGVDD